MPSNRGEGLPFRKVVDVKKTQHKSSPKNSFTAEVELECGHFVRRIWAERPVKRALCRQCLEDELKKKEAES